MITVLNDVSFINACARATHEVNNAFRVAMGQKPYAAWYFLSEEKKGITIKGVLGALTGATPEQIHARWMSDNLIAGWKYGPEYNEKLKTHPCLVPFDDLSNYEKAKDELFIRTVKAMVDAIETGRQK